MKSILLGNLLPRSDNEPVCQCRRCKRRGFNPWVRKIPWRRKWQPSLVFLPGESHGQRSLAGYSPQGCKESDVTERLRTHTSCHKEKSALVGRLLILHTQEFCSGPRIRRPKEPPTSPGTRLQHTSHAATPSV